MPIGVQTKGALLRHTFPSKQAFLATPAAGVERVRAAYAIGAFRAQYLALRYVGFNRPLADALFALHAPSVDGSPKNSRAETAAKADVPAPLPKEMPPTPPADGEASAQMPQAPSAANKIDRRVFKSPSVMRRTFQATELCATPMRGGAKRPAGAAPEGTRVEVKRVRVLVQKRE